ncbi:MAG: hypothetical protein VX910_02555 [Candidatus Latescibacterota bacterium]|nr:hypothetical protein [Candidatus Latescibacterota bacterium]
MVGFLVSVLVLQVYFLSPLKILIVTTTCVSIIALGMLTGKANIPSVPFGKWIFLFMVVFLISGILNQVDLISFAMSWALIFVPPIVCLSIVALRPRRIVVDRLITSNALCVILQIIVLLVQSLLEGRLLWEDAVAGTISRRGVN